MAATLVFILRFIWFYSGLFHRNLQPTGLFVVPAIPDAAGSCEFYEVTFYNSSERVFKSTSTMWDMSATVTYIRDLPFITPAQSSVSIVLT